MADVVHPVTGQVVQVADEDLGLAQRDGYSVATPEQVHDARLKEEYSGLGSAAGAFGTGLLSGATLGLSDAAISSLGGKEALQAYEKYHGGLRTVGEIGGVIGATVLTGGGAGAARGTAGLLGQGARALSAPARFAVRAGEAAEFALGGKALGTIGRAAVEGSIFGAGQGISELSISDDPLTGEKIAAAMSSNMANGALYGGAFGAGMYGLGKGLSSIGRKVMSAGDDGVSTIVQKLDDVSAALGSTKKGDWVRLMSKNAQGVRGYELATKADDLIAHSADEIATAADDVMRARNLVGDNFTGGLKSKQIDRIIRRGNEAEVNLAAKSFATEMKSQLDNMIANDVDFARQGTLKKLAKKVNSVEKKIEAAYSAGDDAANRKAFMQLDDLKRDVGKYTRKAKASRSMTSDMRNTANALEEMYERGRVFLQDTGVWGDAGALQKRMNAPWQAQIGSEKNFIRDIAKWQEGDWGAKSLVVDRERVGKLVKNAANPDQVQTREGLTKWLDSTQDFADAALESMHLPAAERQALEKLSTTTKAMKGKLSQAGEAAELADIVKRMGSQSDAAQLFGGFGGAGVGGVLGGVPGAIIGGAAQIVMNPASMVHKMASAARLVDKVDSKLAGGIKGFVSRAAKKTVPALPRYTSPAAHFLEKENRYDKRAKEVQASATNRDVTQKSIETALAHVAPAAPVASAAAAERFMAVNDLLLGKLPSVSDVMGSKYTLSPTEIDRFMAYDEAATDPLRMPALLDKGELTHDHIDALRDAWPALLADMQMNAMEELVEQEAKGRELPFNEAVRISLLLDIPTDPMLEPDIVAACQGGYQQAQQQPEAHGPPQQKRTSPSKVKDLSSGFATGSQSLSQES